MGMAGGPGGLLPRGSHRSVRAQLRHTAPQDLDSHRCYLSDFCPTLVELDVSGVVRSNRSRPRHPLPYQQGRSGSYPCLPQYYGVLRLPNAHPASLWSSLCSAVPPPRDDGDVRVYRGRDARCRAPPAQIPA
jgi:hypothetical protein